MGVDSTAGFKQKDWRRNPGVFMSICFGTMALLIVLALIYASGNSRWPHWEYSFTDVMPLWVPWAGALGGTTISLVGTVKHTKDWEPSYWIWHLARPLLGGVCGTIGVLVIILVLNGVQGAPVDDAGKAVTANYDDPGIAVLCVFAFIIGYREQTFRDLVKRVADVILGPGEADALATVAFVPSLVSLVSAAGAEVTADVYLTNSTKDALLLSVSATGAGVVAAVDSPTDPVPAGSSRKVTVTWTPSKSDDTVDGTVTATLGGHSATLTVKGRPAA